MNVCSFIQYLVFNNFTWILYKTDLWLPLMLQNQTLST